MAAVLHYRPVAAAFPAAGHVTVVLLLAINIAVIASGSCPQTDIMVDTLCRSRRSYDSTNSKPGVAGNSHGRHQQLPSPNAVVKDSAVAATAAGIVTSGGRSAVFATENSTVVAAQIGGTATLPCVVRKFSNGVVSWIRKDDHEAPSLLTVGLTTYSADDRFLVEHVRHLQNWGLLIKHVQPTDAGLYECQVSTHPTTSIFLELRVTEASAEIVGAPDLHLHAGSTLRLTCTLRQSTETPTYVFWYHDSRMINYDPGVQVIPSKASSTLALPDADHSHTGNYTCSPSNAIPASINVHVLNATEEENPAAMLHKNYGFQLQSSFSINILFAVSLSTMVLQFQTVS